MGQGGRAITLGRDRILPLRGFGDSDSPTRSQFTALTYIFPTVHCQPSEAAVWPFSPLVS